MSTWIRSSALVAVVTAAFGQERPAGDPGSPAAGIVWDARAAEHLLNRAGFGAGPRQVERAVERGFEATLDELLASSPFLEDPFYARVRTRSEGAPEPPGSEEERLERQRRMRMADEEQLYEFLRWWLERLVSGEDPLRERMTLFWHGYFTSSQQDVKNSHEMILQNQLLRTGALGSFADLLREMARNPAMLEYLDNDSSSKQSPNENFARELLELFTLGEGNYAEQDVKEVARAFTGWSDRNGDFRFRRREHDDGQKSVLGVSGALNGDDVLAILLDQEACGRHVARSILAYLEGVEPEERRVASYGAFLREHGWDVGALLRRLFADPDFYRSEVVGTRIAGPVDFLVGTARRLGIDPPPRLLVAASAVLGQRLFFPPNVKGWEEGRAWITTSSVIQRANFAGVLLGVVELADILDYDPNDDSQFLPAEDAGAASMGSSMEPAEAAEPVPQKPEAAPRGRGRKAKGELGKLQGLAKLGWQPRLSLTARCQTRGLVSDAEIVSALLDELLAVEAAAGTHAALCSFFAERRAALDLEGERLFSDPLASEPLLRGLAHLVLCLPEAQLH